MRWLPLLLLAAATLFAERVGGQGLPYRVTIVDWTPRARAQQDRAYRQAPSDRELVFCITSWRQVPGDRDHDRIVIEAVRQGKAGTLTKVADVAGECIGPDGKPQPMFHTHADGNCQQSPSDLVTLVARGAPFEGVQCGRWHFVWAFAWQVNAIVEAATRGTPPDAWEGSADVTAFGPVAADVARRSFRRRAGRTRRDRSGAGGGLGRAPAHRGGRDYPPTISESTAPVQ